MTISPQVRGGLFGGLWQYGLIVQNWPTRRKAWDGIVDTTVVCPKKLRELAILTTARIWDAEFEWAAHVGHAREAGLSEDIIQALHTDQEVTLTTDAETVVYSVTQTLNTTRALPDDLYQKAHEILGPDQLVDLIGLLGYYALISMTIKAFDIDPNELNTPKEQVTQ